MSDLIAEDKALHAAAGAAVGAVAACAWAELRPEAARWERVVAGILAATVVGLAKEAYDREHPRDHDADVLDAAATTIGGAAGAAITLVIRF